MRESQTTLLFERLPSPHRASAPWIQPKHRRRKKISALYWHVLVLSLLLTSTLLHAASALAPYRIEVVEKGSGWPIPLAELRTTSDVRFVTDNAGLVAFDLPECMGRETWFTVTSPGYTVPVDGFGSWGVRCTPQPGGKFRIEMTRTSLARRIGRLTGSGIFAESQKLGERLDWKESGVTGSDTLLLTPYHDKLFWAWGDTNLFHYPLGIYNTTAATTPLHPLTTFEPPLALSFDYFRGSDARPHGVVDMKATGPIWVSACVTLPDAQGHEHLVCQYRKVENHLAVAELGLAEWDDAAGSFQSIAVLWKKSDGPIPTFPPAGHHAFWQDPAGKRWLYVGEGLPKFRCPATYEDWKNPASWEKVETPGSLVSATDGKPVTIATGAVAFNPWRKRWVTVFQQRYGNPSTFGEIWYAEADAPAGPWGKAIKVLSHQNYTFYNVLLHPELVAPDAHFLLFEGTYTAEFANHPTPTARYNYNQILYRLDLDDPALAESQK